MSQKIDQVTMEKIRRLLEKIEHEKGISTLFAVESGSRLWGMASQNSDYDIRFVYHRPVTHYLKLFQRGRDTIEYMEQVDGLEIDLVGWDIDKFLGLLHKSNPSCLEWLKADIIYKGSPDRFRRFLEYVNPITLYHHYRSISYGQFKRYIEGKEEVIIKKYLYVLRGMINAQYVLQEKRVPETDLLTTARKLKHLDNEILKLLEALIDKKKKDEELGLSTRIDAIDQYGQKFYDQLDEHNILLQEIKPKKIPVGELNTLFLEIIGFK